ncbi:MAG: efflux RND transporter periplasmic adaptor subunit, partial [Muribaculaceae bacterium]|nr:efflux RND transporter periplasmic adaptor subunit [Muribaculaceae bacterium]
PQVDPQTGTFSVRAEMPNPSHQLLPGEYTKVRVLLDLRERAIEIPSKALVVEKGAAYVYVVRPDSVVEKRFIETGPETDNKVIVERGLAQGEKIVTEGYHKLSHAMKINPVPASKPEETEE